MKRLSSIFFKSKKDHHQTSPSPCCTTTPPPPPAWAWPSCKHPRTHSFRRSGDVYVNSVFVDSLDQEEDDDDDEYDRQVESVNISRLRSERLFFDRGGDSSSIIEEGKKIKRKGLIKKESVAEEMESENPYVDFKMSMEEMVSAHGLKEWEGLEEMLQWYLSVNGNTTHGFIVGAFLDLLFDLVSPFANSTTSLSSSPSPSSSLSSSSSCVN